MWQQVGWRQYRKVQGTPEEEKRDAERRDEELLKAIKHHRINWEEGQKKARSGQMRSKITVGVLLALLVINICLAVMLHWPIGEGIFAAIVVCNTMVILTLLIINELKGRRR